MTTCELHNSVILFLFFFFLFLALNHLFSHLLYLVLFLFCVPWFTRCLCCSPFSALYRAPMYCSLHSALFFSLYLSVSNLISCCPSSNNSPSQTPCPSHFIPPSLHPSLLHPSLAWQPVISSHGFNFGLPAPPSLSILSAFFTRVCAFSCK